MRGKGRQWKNERGKKRREGSERKRNHIKVGNMRSTLGLEFHRTAQGLQQERTFMWRPQRLPNHHHFSHKRLTSSSVNTKTVKAQPPKCSYPNQNITGIFSLLGKKKSSSFFLKAMCLPSGSEFLLPTVPRKLLFPESDQYQKRDLSKEVLHQRPGGKQPRCTSKSVKR